MYLVEEVLQLFIGQVDADLFKAINFKVLKPKYVEDSNCLRGWDVHRWTEQLVDLRDQPQEQSLVQEFGHGITRNTALNSRID